MATVVNLSAFDFALYVNGRRVQVQSLDRDLTGDQVTVTFRMRSTYLEEVVASKLEAETADGIWVNNEIAMIKMGPKLPQCGLVRVLDPVAPLPGQEPQMRVVALGQVHDFRPTTKNVCFLVDGEEGIVPVMWLQRQFIRPAKP